MTTLCNSEQRTTALLDSLACMVYRCRYDHHMTIEYSSSGCVQLIGRDPAALVGGPALVKSAFIHPGDQFSTVAKIVRALHDRVPYRLSYRISKADGTQSWVEERGQGVYCERGKITALEGIISESSCLAQLKEWSVRQTARDGLTGLLNRDEFEKRLREALGAAKTRRTESVFCYLDLDQFKLVNDSVGHRAGDELLRQVARLFAATLPADCVLARLGGDEFGVLLNGNSRAGGVATANAIIAALKRYRFSWREDSFAVGVSIGVVAVTPHAETVSRLLAEADVACYTAKDSGGNQACFYHRDNAQLVKRHQEIILASELKDALNESRFSLYWQPIVRVSPVSRPAAGERRHEVLLRLNDRSGRTVSPGSFIPAAERYNMMPEIDLWVVRTVLDSYRRLFGSDKTCNRLNINLSGNTLNDEAALDSIYRLVRGSGVAAENLCFEITETSVVSSLKKALKFITKMRALGCRFALDDFGSGLCSFSYLQRFPVDYLKIDGCFVRDLNNNATHLALLSAMIQVSQAFGLETIAECVEDASTIDILTEAGIDYIQGYAIGRPEPMPDRQQASALALSNTA